jgi:hypothetical protein
MVSFHDVLHALVGGQSDKLNDSGWVAEAHQAIDDHARAAEPGKAAEEPADGGPTDDPSVPPASYGGGL